MLSVSGKNRLVQRSVKLIKRLEMRLDVLTSDSGIPPVIINEVSKLLTDERAALQIVMNMPTKAMRKRNAK